MNTMYEKLIWINVIIDWSAQIMWLLLVSEKKTNVDINIYLKKLEFKHIKIPPLNVV